MILHLIALSLALLEAGFAQPPEWRQSEPDYQVYLPSEPNRADNTNQHFLVIPLKSGTFFAVWTTGSRESASNHRIVCSRSSDQGRTWSELVEIDGPAPTDAPGTGLASWGFPIYVESSGRLYVFFNKNVGLEDMRSADTGVLRARWSDDEGRTWSTEHRDYPIARSAFSNPDRKVPANWIVYQVPVVSPGGAVIVGFTRWASKVIDVGAPESMFLRRSESWFLRFENILTERNPSRLRVTTWPKGDHGITVSAPVRGGISVAQEPSIQALSDGRLICVMRTMTGQIWFSLSRDDGRSWSAAEPLRYQSGGAPILNPIAPCPLYKLKDGRFLLVFYNNDGGPGGPTDQAKNRSPAWYTVGREVPGHPTHPMRFGPPQILVRNDGLPKPGRGAVIGAYTSFFEHQGVRYFWYPDRKHYLLGKRITDEMLSAADPDAQATQRR